MRMGLDDLAAFEMVATEGSFTRAAARLGVSPSALSHTMRELEGRLAVRLLARTTRSVAPTEIGDQRGKVVGTLRLTAPTHAFESLLRPVLPAFLANNPGARIEFSLDDELINIIAGRFDAGLRLGRLVEKDMIAVKVGPDLQLAVVASPAYLAQHPVPQTPQDLAQNLCINYRTTGSGDLYVWQLEKGGRHIDVRVSGGLTLNDGSAIRAATLDGMGLACLFLDHVKEELAKGTLVRVSGRLVPTVPRLPPLPFKPPPSAPRARRISEGAENESA